MCFMYAKSFSKVLTKHTPGDLFRIKWKKETEALKTCLLVAHLKNITEGSNTQPSVLIAIKAMIPRPDLKPGWKSSTTQRIGCGNFLASSTRKSSCAKSFARSKEPCLYAAQRKPLSFSWSYFLISGLDFLNSQSLLSLVKFEAIDLKVCSGVETD